MKICFSSRERIWGGGEVFLLSLARSSRDAGFEVEWRVPAGSELEQRADFGKVKPRHIPFHGDLLVANDFRSYWVSMFREPLCRRHLVLHGAWQISRVRAALVSLDNGSVSSVSKQVANAANQHLAGGSNHILPLGVMNNKPAHSAYKPPKQLSDLVVIGIARPDPVKRIDLWVEVLRRLNCKGIFVSNPSNDQERQRLESLFSRVPKVQLVTTGNPDSAYLQGNVFLSTSLTESFGIAHLEALQAGMPVFSTASHGPSDFLTGPLRIGYMPGLGNAEEIASKILAALPQLESSAFEYESAIDRTLSVRSIEKCLEVVVNAPSVRL